ncbi:MAG: TlpA family protein disulfide reductase [Chloroflexi bacterium]|nr:TlpA family protein disulfide reductase [Chloroflexota bacterium]
MPRWIQAAVFVLVIAVIVFFAFGLRVRGEAQPSTGLAPDFALKTFDGQSVRLSELRGKVVVVNFWASWCIPCRDEADLLEKTYEQYKDRGVVFMGVDWVDPEPDALAYIKQYHITYLNGPDLGTAIAPLYRIKGVPETYFVAKDGTIAGNSLGPIGDNSGYMTTAQFIQKLNTLLAAD